MTRVYRALSRLHDALGRLLAVMEAAESALREGDRISIRWAAPTPPVVHRHPSVVAADPACMCGGCRAGRARRGQA